VAEKPYDLDCEQVLLVLAQDYVGAVALGIEHPLLPLTYVVSILPSSQSMVLGMRTSLFFSERMVNTSKKLMLESRCSRCS